MGALQYLVSYYMFIKYLEVEQFQVRFCWLLTSATTSSCFYADKRSREEATTTSKLEFAILCPTILPALPAGLYHAEGRVSENRNYSVYKTKLAKDPSKISSEFYVKDYRYPWLVL